MSDNFKYYGFYGRKGNTDDINYRASRQKASSDSQFNEKEFGVYVHNLFEEIPEHLEKEYSKSGDFGKNYGQVKNLTFVPIKELPDEDITKVQNLIDVCYTFFRVSKDDDRISWAKMHALGREYMYSGYNSELSKEIMDSIAKEAAIIARDNKNLDDNQKQSLLIQSQRTCDKIHDVDHLKKDKTKDYNKIILQDYILKDDEKQLILGFFGNDDIKQYKNNPYIYDEPWLFMSTGLGFFVWNIMINKATIKCILDNSKTLFPMQIILSTNPNYLFYEQIDNDEINIKYIGYFIARIKLDELDKPTVIDPECKRLYNYKNDSPHESKEQYFVIFIFKKLGDNIKNDVDRYILTDFRLQRIHWGNLTRSKKVLLIEIQQLMCSSLSLLEEGKNKIYFYLLSEYETGTNQSVNEICKSQDEEVKKTDNDKIKNKDCYQAWLHEDTIKKLNENKIKLKGNSYKIFVAKKDLNGIHDELVVRNELVDKNGEAKKDSKIGLFIPDDPTFKRLIITEKITEEIDESVKVSVKEYILLPCHFKWETIDKKKKFVLKHGDLEFKDKDLESENFYKDQLCINSTCILNRDYVMHPMNNIKLFNNNIENPKNYDDKLEQVKQNILELKGGSNHINKINKLIKKIYIYRNNLYFILLSNYLLLLNNQNILKNINFNINNILGIKVQQNKYLNTSNYIENNLKQFINIIKYIIDGDILIISNNINILLLLDKYLDIKDNNITLIIVNVYINNVNILHSLKLKNINKIKIHYFGNILNNKLIENIINLFPNKKFKNIIIDITKNNEFFNILGIKICKELLIPNSTFIQFTKLPSNENNLINLYLTYKSFKYNIFENYTSYLIYYDQKTQKNMYSFIYHLYYEYNLNKDDEKLINQLLNKYTLYENNSSILNTNTYNLLFIDFLYIKYLSIFYDLDNFAKNIFIKINNIIENNNTIEQKGGYILSNDINLDLYDSKYTCTFLEKQLFLLHLNCLTKVYLHENKNLDNFYIYYDNNDYGYYQEILKNMFKQLTWTNTNKHIKSKECIFISNNLDMYHKIKPKYALIDFKPDTDNNFFDCEILYTLYPFSNTDFKILVKEYNKIKKYSVNIFQELLDNNKFVRLCYNNDLYNINKVIPIKYLKLIPGYTDNFECILEYKILYNYFYHIHDITDHKIIINKLFDITIDNENNMKYWLTCTLKKFQNAIKETDIMFKNIIQLNIEQHAKHQIQLLKEYGSEVLNKKKINKAIKILEKYASDRVYIQIL